ncbi:hypothetical protein KA093_02010 [Candidatus Saccharibacteria bacterium]|nr:hypothetical protein [Candidatus Saccharibacteria bacterium]
METVSPSPKHRTRLRSLLTKKHLFFAGVIVVVAVGSAFLISFLIRQATIRSIITEADTAATEYTKAAETFVMTSLREAIVTSESKDRDIMDAAASSRPEPPSSLDAVLTKEQRAALFAPYPLTYDVSAKAVASLSPPKLKVVADGGQYSEKYRVATNLHNDVDAIYNRITSKYATENCRVRITNDIMAFDNEVLATNEVERREDAIGVKEIYEARKVIFQKYQAKIVNDSTKTCLKKSSYSVFERQFKNAIAQQDIIITKISEGVRGEPLAAPIKSEGNSFKEIISMRLALAIANFDQNTRTGADLLYDFAIKHFAYLNPNPVHFINL